MADLNAILDSIKELKLLEVAELVKMMEEHKTGKCDNSRRIWTVYVFLIWHKVYFEDESFKPINDQWLKKRVKTL